MDSRLFKLPNMLKIDHSAIDGPFLVYSSGALLAARTGAQLVRQVRALRCRFALSCFSIQAPRNSPSIKKEQMIGDQVLMVQ